MIYYNFLSIIIQSLGRIKSHFVSLKVSWMLAYINITVWKFDMLTVEIWINQLLVQFIAIFGIENQLTSFCILRRICYIFSHSGSTSSLGISPSVRSSMWSSACSCSAFPSTRIEGLLVDGLEVASTLDPHFLALTSDALGSYFSRTVNGSSWTSSGYSS